MKLDSLDGEFAMTQTHDDGVTVAVHGAGADLKFFRERLFGDGQGMITGGGHGRLDAAEDGASVMFNFAGFPVHEVRSANYVAAKCSTNSLVSETNAENRSLSGEVENDRNALACLLRSAGAGGDQDAVWTQGFYLFGTDLIVSTHFNVGTEFTEVLDQVVGERVVVVQNKDAESSLVAGRWLLVQISFH